jgi:PKD repeat protein
MIVDVPPQALPVGSEVTVTEIAPLEVPADITPLGPAYRIEAAAVPAEPVALQIPVPEGEDPEGIAIVHFHGGEVDLVGGQVVDGVFHTALSSFSDIQLVKARIDEITSIAGVPPVDLDLEGADSETGPLAVEHGQLVTGERSEPAPRVISIVGPTEIAVGRLAVFTATGFASEHPEFVEYEWRVLGRNDAGVPGDGLIQRQLFLTVGRTGRYTVMVDARDPVTGAEAFAALTVFADEEAFTVFANPDLVIGAEPVVEVNVINSVGDVDLLWGFSNGAGGRNTINTPGEAVEPGSATVYGPVFFRPGVEELEEDLGFEVLATDAEGAYSHVSIVLTATEDGRPRGAIVGPTSIEVGEAAMFTALTENVQGLSLVWDATPGVDMDLAGDTASAVWEESGIARVGLFALVDDGEGPIPIHLDTVAVAVTGDPLPLAVSHRTPPDTLMVGETGTWTARIRGGVVAAATGPRGYELTVDFDDDTAQELEIPAASALEGVFQEVTHSFEEPGTYDVTFTVTSSDGQTDDATATVVVSDRITVEAQAPVRDDIGFPYTVLANRIRIVIFSDAVRLRIFELTTESMPHTGFTINSSGEEDTFAADCTNTHEILSHEFSGTYDPATGVVTGTVAFERHRADTGPECPFGGFDVIESRVGTLEATIADGVVAVSITTADDQQPTFTYLFEGTVVEE